MFENLYTFFSINKSKSELKSVNEFIEFYQGKSFKNGLFRLHNKNCVEKWNEIVTDAFPQAKRFIECFGYDWLGRQYAVYKGTNTVFIFEPGTGYALNTEATLEDFLLNEITNDDGAALCFDFFKKWKKYNSDEIGLADCVGYKIPLFLGGEDEISNLEITDMEIYWGICGQLITKC